MKTCIAIGCDNAVSTFTHGLNGVSYLRNWCDACTLERRLVRKMLNPPKKKRLSPGKQVRKRNKQKTKRKVLLRSIKLRAIAYLGGKCQDPDCVLQNVELPWYAYDFHHRDPSIKSFEISDIMRSYVTEEMVIQELDKCDLLCCICHRKRHINHDIPLLINSQ